MFLWQLPHFLAIAWMYRDDYARAGFPMLPVIEPDGRSTGRQAVIYAAALIPLSLAPTPMHMAGDYYFAGARRNVDKRGYQLTQELLAGKHSSLREGIVR